MAELSIVVPTYNEKEALPLLLERISIALKDIDFEVIVVDDNSPDGTWALAQKLAETRYPWLRVIRRVGVKGLASAVVDGIRAARGTYVAVMDADLQHPPETLKAMLKKAREGYDLVIASRYTRGGGTEGWSRVRLFMSRSATLLAHLLVPESRVASDPMSGFFLVKRSSIVRCLDRLKPRGYKILLEILARCPGLRVTEVGYIFRERAAGRSKLGLVALLDYLRQLLDLNNYRVFKMAAVGLTGLAVLYTVNTVLLALGLHRLLTYAIAIEVSILNNFALNNLWTFRGRGRGKPLLLKALQYHYSVALGATVNYATYQVLSTLGIADPIAVVTGVALGYAANYTLAEHHVWTSESRVRKTLQQPAA